MSLVSQFILILVLTLLNAFFASAEMAIVSVNRNWIKMLADDGNKKASLLVDLLEEPNKFLSTIQVGITLAGFFSSASAATGISEVIGASLSQLGIPYAQSISLVVITIILSYFTLVFGELVPKRIALQNQNRWRCCRWDRLSLFLNLRNLSLNSYLYRLTYYFESLEWATRI